MDDANRPLIRTELLDRVLRALFSPGEPVFSHFTSDEPDAFAFTLESYAAYLSGDFEHATRCAQDAALAAADPEGRLFAHAAQSLVYDGWTRDAQAHPLEAALAERGALTNLPEALRIFAHYLLAEASIICTRLDLGWKVVEAMGHDPASFLADPDHPFLTIVRSVRVRLLVFRGEIAQAQHAAAAAVALAHGHTPTWFARAVHTFVLGCANEQRAVRAGANALEAAVPLPRNYLERVMQMYVALGLYMVGDLERAATFILVAGGSTELDRLYVIDRVFGLDVLVTAACAAGDVDAAHAWEARAIPFADHAIVGPVVERLRSRVRLAAGDASQAAELSTASVSRMQLHDREVEAREAAMLQARARIALLERGAAAELLQTIARDAEVAGATALRAAAARELKLLGRRIRPVAGSGWAGLSEREREVARLVAGGLSNGQIASELHLSEHTVRVHVSRVLAAFGTATRIGVISGIARVGGMAPEADAAARTPLTPLTPRQTAVARLVSVGRSNSGISAELGISVKAVEKHIGDIFRRWNITSRAGIARHAAELPTDT